MSRGVPVKICGVRTQGDLDMIAAAGARYVGFNFFAKSPRSVSFAEARALAVETPLGLAKVGLVVDPDTALLDALTAEVPLDFLQLHGSESPDYVAEIKARYGLPVIKVVGIADAEDLPRLDAHEVVADQILVDAKPPRNAELPGGNGLAFDWRLIAGRDWKTPWMLAGGLKPDNVATAISATGAPQVDVASGVEAAPGVKDPDLVKAFIANAQPG